MPITLRKAAQEDLELIHKIQVESFSALLEKYQDYDTNPGAEGLERIFQRFAQPFTDYYLIARAGKPVGALRVCNWGDHCRLSPICILPEFQGHGYAQQAMRLAEALYPTACRWTLDTIAQERNLCYLYEKMGYRKTGERQSVKDGMDLIFYEKKCIKH